MRPGARAGVPCADNDDLIQEVLLIIFREVGGFERRGEGAFRAWLRIILVHRMRALTSVESCEAIVPDTGE